MLDQKCPFIESEKVAELQARISELEDALRPLARIGNEYHSSISNDLFVAYGDVTVGDLRRAAALLGEKGGKA